MSPERAAARRRLDAELVRRGLSPTRERAQALVASGLVLVGGTLAEKPSRLVAAHEPVRLLGREPYVSRGGHKLAAALERFSVEVAGRQALDAGASTGGFTDCLLQHGAASVVALDVGRGQLHERLRSDPRVRSIERTNVRWVRADELGGPFPLVVADLSFISLTVLRRQLATELASPGADLVLLVKPQFEVGRLVASRGRGVVREPQRWLETLRTVASSYAEIGVGKMGAMPSPLLGASGNVEFLLHLSAPARDEGRTADEECPPRGRQDDGRDDWAEAVVDEAVRTIAVAGGAAR